MKCEERKLGRAIGTNLTSFKLNWKLDLFEKLN